MTCYLDTIHLLVDFERTQSFKCLYSGTVGRRKAVEVSKMMHGLCYTIISITFHHIHHQQCHQRLIYLYIHIYIVYSDMSPETSTLMQTPPSQSAHITLIKRKWWLYSKSSLWIRCSLCSTFNKVPISNT